MLKVVMLLARGEGLAPDDFLRHLRETHLPLLGALPGLRQLAAGGVLAPPAGPAAAWDAVVELWFADLAAFQAAFTAPEAQAVATDAPAFQDLAAYQQLLVEEAPEGIGAGGAGR